MQAARQNQLRSKMDELWARWAATKSAEDYKAWRNVADALWDEKETG